MKLPSSITSYSKTYMYQIFDVENFKFSLNFSYALTNLTYHQ